MNLSTNTPQVVAAGNLLNNGSITMVAPPSTGTGSLFLPPPTLVIASTGTLSGTGFITGSVSNFGTVRPGDLTGTLTIFGLYQQMTGSTLDIWLGGANAGQFGQLAVNGDAALGGTLDVELYAGFDPESGEIFEILSGNISGAFADVDLPTLGAWRCLFKLDQEAKKPSLLGCGRQHQRRRKWRRLHDRARTCGVDPAAVRPIRPVRSQKSGATQSTAPVLNVPSATHTRAPDQYHVRSAHARAWFPMAHAE